MDIDDDKPPASDVSPLPAPGNSGRVTVTIDQAGTRTALGPEIEPELARRVAELEKLLAQPRRRWWHQWLSVAAVTALVSVAVPVSSASSGCAATRLALRESEHQIAKEHLDAALQHPVEDENHLRHIRFLRQVESEATWWERLGSDASMTSNLAAWADLEYEQYFCYLEARIGVLRAKHRDVVLEEARLRRRVLVDDGWRRQEDAKLIQLASIPVEPARGAARKQAQPKRADIDDEAASATQRAEDLVAEELNRREECTKERAALEAEFERLRVPYDLDASRRLEPLPATARDILDEECKAGKMQQCLELGELHWAIAHHEPSEPGYSLLEAAELFRKACDRNFAHGCANYARALVHGKGVLANSVEAARRLQLACADLHDPAACNGLGWRYYHGGIEGVEGDERFARAEELFVSSCANGYMNGCDSAGTSVYRRAMQETGAKRDALIDNARVQFDYACRRKEVRGCMNLALLDAGQPPSVFSNH